MNQIIMILLISILVLVHEIGHYIAARLCGVRVVRFGIGMPIGPEWKMFRWGDTDFYIHAFLFGGYVAFLDDMDSFKKETHKTDDNDTLPQNSPELFENKTILQKFFIVSAGVTMNVIFAIFLVMFCAAVFKHLPTSTQELYVMGFVNPMNKEQTMRFASWASTEGEKVSSNVNTKGFLVRDRILKANGINIDTPYQLRFFAQKSKLFDDYADNGLIEKNLTELKKLNPSLNDTIVKDTKIFLPSIMPENPLSVNKKIIKGFEKYQPEGTKLTQNQIDLRNEIYGKTSYKTTKETALNDLAYALSDTYKPVTITVLRNNKEIDFSNIIVFGQNGLFGIKLCVKDIYTQTVTLKSIVVNSVKYCYTTTAAMLEGLWQLIAGKIQVTQMHGVIAVVKIGGDIIASKGILNGLLLTAMISLNLAIMNFLPIPALDGGHVMFLIIEKITGKKPSKEFSDKLTNFFFILLVLLMIAICYNDIFALITNKF